MSLKHFVPSEDVQERIKILARASALLGFDEKSQADFELLIKSVAYLSYLDGKIEGMTEALNDLKPESNSENSN